VEADPGVLTLRGLALRLPDACACCLRPPGRRPLEVAVADPAMVGSFVLTLLAAYQQARDGTRFSVEEAAGGLCLPVCDDCRDHEVGPRMAWVVGLALGAVVGAGAMFFTLPRGDGLRSLGLGLAAGLGTTAAVGLLGGLAVGERRAGCTRRPVAWLRRSPGGYELGLGQPDFAEQVRSLNRDALA
jgi:hypothetical protein